MKKITFILITLSILISSSLFGQNKKNEAQPELESGTIEQQFDYIITKSTKFRDFQLIRKTSILKIKAHTIDSIRTVRKELAASNKSIAQLQGTIGQLNNEVQTLKDEVASISKEVDSISFLGMSLSKPTYSTLVWSIIIILILALLVFITQFNKSNLVTRRTKNELSKIEIEFESFRKKSMTKEQETMRKLQDEINKNNP